MGDDSVNVFSYLYIKGGCAMKVVYPVCCGIDVHKTFLFAIINTSQGITSHYSKIDFQLLTIQFFNSSSGLLITTALVCVWNLQVNWIPFYNLLEDSIRITIANPK